MIAMTIAARQRPWDAGNMYLLSWRARPMTARATYDAGIGQPEGWEGKTSATTSSDHRASGRRSRRLRRDLAAQPRARHRDLCDLPDPRTGGLEPRRREV